MKLARHHDSEMSSKSRRMNPSARRQSECVGEAVGCLGGNGDDAVKGIITDRDLLGCLAQMHDPYRCEVSAHMRRPVIVLRPEEEATDWLPKVMRQQTHQAPACGEKRQAFRHCFLSDLAALASRRSDKTWFSLGFLRWRQSGRSQREHQFAEGYGVARTAGPSDAGLAA